MNLLPLLPNVATNYGLDCPRFEFLWLRDFPHPYRQTLRPTQLSVQWVPSFFSGDKAAEAWLWSPTRICPVLEWSLLYYLFHFFLHCIVYILNEAKYNKKIRPYSVSWLISMVVFIFGAYYAKYGCGICMYLLYPRQSIVNGLRFRSKNVS